MPLPPRSFDGGPPTPAAQSTVEVAVLLALLEHSENALVYLDRDFNFVWVNRAYAEACRRAPEAFAGHNHFELYPHEENRRIFEKARDTGEPAVWREKPFVFPDMPQRGVTYWDWTLTPIKGADGAVNGFVLSLAEVTEKVRTRQAVEADMNALRRAEEALRESEARFRVLVEASSQAVWETDASGAAVTDSPSWRAYTGQALEERLGYGWVNAVHPDDRAHVEREWRESVAAGRALDTELRIRSPGGGWRWTNVRAAPIRNPDGSVSKWVGMNIDITARKLAEDALRESEQRHRLLADTLLHGVVHQGADGTIISMNPAAERILGRTREDFVGSSSVGEERHTIREDGSPFPGLEHPAMVALRTGQAVRAVVMGVWNPRDGGHRWISIDAIPLLRPGESRPHQVYTVFADITERKRAEEALRASEEKYRTLFANMAEEVHFWQLVRDEAGHIETWRLVDANPPALKSWGRQTVEEVRGKTADEILGPGATEHYMPVVRKIMAEGAPHSFVDYLPNLGKYLRLTSVPLGDHFITTGVDLTEITQAGEKLTAANLQLAEADRRKNEFLAMLSHELRNPLAPITNSLYVLDHAPPGGEQADRAKRVIGRQVAQLSDLVNDLLDVTRISRNKIQLQNEKLDLDEALRRAVEDNRSLFEQAGVHLELAAAPGLVPVLADRTRVAQIVGNVLQNAAKFTGKGGHTRVSLTVEGSEALVRVADDGIGMSRETLDRLFQPFSQAQQTLDRSKGGLGLGLALVKGLVELHGGTVSAHSEGLGHGTEVTIRLPLDAGAGLEPGATHVCPARARRRVLIIEDNVDAADSLRTALELGGHEVAVAYDGLGGLVKARELRPDVVLCDIGLPGMDGYDVARAIRADESLRRTFLIALSGYALPEDLQRAADAGFQRHLAKPPSLANLEQLLAQAPRIVSGVLPATRTPPTLLSGQS